MAVTRGSSGNYCGCIVTTMDSPHRMSLRDPRHGPPSRTASPSTCRPSSASGLRRAPSASGERSASVSAMRRSVSIASRGSSSGGSGGRSRAGRESSLIRRSGTLFTVGHSTLSSRMPDTDAWSNMWRSVPEHLVDDYRSLGWKARGTVGRILAELEQGAPSLHIGDCELGDAGGLIIAEALRRYGSPNLHCLNLSANRLGDRAIVEIANSADGLLGLTNMCLSWNDVMDEGAFRLAELVETHPALRCLSLEGNRIGDAGASRLLVALANKSLHREVSCPFAGNPLRKFHGPSRENLTATANVLSNLAQRSVTLGEILTLYTTGLAQGLIHPDLTTTRQALDKLVLPPTESLGQSFVEVCSPNNPPSPVKVMHAWDACFHDFVKALAEHATRRTNPSLDPSDDLYRIHRQLLTKPYFIDVFCVNQHVSMNHLRHLGLRSGNAFIGGEPGSQHDKMDLVTDVICRRGGSVVVIADIKNVVLSRFNCLVEIHHAIVHGYPIEIKCTRPGQIPRPCKVRDSSSGGERDRQIGLDEIAASAGGLEKFDLAVNNFFDDWATKQHQELLQQLMDDAEGRLRRPSVAVEAAPPASPIGADSRSFSASPGKSGIRRNRSDSLGGTRSIDRRAGRAGA